jgi:hypothetical protein
VTKPAFKFGISRTQPHVFDTTPILLSVHTLRVDPAFASLRGDPQFEALLADPKNHAPLF